ncbi:hypothetical protein NIES267_32920 [Calothrix parasitica NIES-267]|uniref:Uncharacterized protein n=1 Tax=Calothrix parasitica NIES-267 TaxID=1973488 RepID=A0A1Z4LRT8_9CYAN|nr:hypothetical protein NIES267_32920 [Calothrix parasitica NIES-267]
MVILSQFEVVIMFYIYRAMWNWGIGGDGERGRWGEREMGRGGDKS